MSFLDFLDRHFGVLAVLTWSLILAAVAANALRKKK